MAAPTLQLEEYQYSDAGVLLNGSASLPFVDITSVQGLDNPEYRVQTHDREGVDGGYVEALYESVRTVTLEGTIYADPSNMETYLDSLKANFAPTPVDKPLYFKTDAGDRCVFGKALGIRYNKDQLRRIGSSSCQIQVMCQDSRIYDVTVITSSRVGTGSITLTLGGNRTSPGSITLAGPITGASIAHDISGTTMSFPGYALSAGQTLEINLNNRSVLLNGTTNYRNLMTLTGDWYEFWPSDNILTLSGTSTSGSTQLIATSRSAWR